MKKLLFPIIGSVLAGGICNLLFWSTGQLALALNLRLYNSEDEASRNFSIFLICFVVFIIFGAIYGYWIAKKSEKNNS